MQLRGSDTRFWDIEAAAQATIEAAERLAATVAGDERRIRAVVMFEEAIDQAVELLGEQLLAEDLDVMSARAN